MKRRWRRIFRQPLTRRERRAVLGGLVLVGLALFYAYVQQPLAAGLEEARLQAGVAEAQLEAARRTAGALPAAETRLEDLRQSAVAAVQAVPSGREEPAFLRELEQVAADTGVTIREVSFGSSTQASGLTTYPVHLTVAGPEAAVRRFLGRLEGMNRAVQVRGFSYRNQVLTIEAAIFSL